jgi:DnaJ-domain-containing protein 1
MLRKLFINRQFKSFSLNNQNKYGYFGQQPNFDPRKDYYQMLNISKNASESEIKRTYYDLAKRYHPDVSKGN